MLICLFVVIIIIQQITNDKSIDVIKGEVIKVYDGDTITVFKSNEKHKIRLDGIDAPELKQKFGKESRNFLNQKLLGKNVEIKIKNIDIYQRKVGEVYQNSELVNLTMINEGYAWHYFEYNKNKNYSKAQNTAKINKIGLWKEKSPVAPWEWRKQHKR